MPDDDKLNEILTKMNRATELDCWLFGAIGAGLGGLIVFCVMTLLTCPPSVLGF